jgi:N-acetylmuramoyl-L-alanine amidase
MRRRAWLFAALASIAVLSGAGIAARLDTLRHEAALRRQVDLTCLAENIYYEARGEPLAGQYAVAEVTLNRVASARFPDTVCGVVQEKHWDAARKSYVAAFSWTVRVSGIPRAEPAWQRAMTVAASAYDNREAPLVGGALFYHATYVTPAWARTKTRVARIERHVFYL